MRECSTFLQYLGVVFVVDWYIWDACIMVGRVCNPFGSRKKACESLDGSHTLFYLKNAYSSYKSEVTRYGFCTIKGSPFLNTLLCRNTDPFTRTKLAKLRGLSSPLLTPPAQSSFYPCCDVSYRYKP